MKARHDSISEETGDVGTYSMSKILRSGHQMDHGVVMSSDKDERDRILRLTPKVSSEGIDGRKVKAFPVTDPEGKPLSGGYQALLKGRFRQAIWDMAEQFGYSDQWLLNWALEKADIWPRGDTLEAYRGARAFYRDPTDDTKLVFLASKETVAALVRPNREASCNGGQLFSGIERGPIWHKKEKLTAKSVVDYGYYLLPPPFTYQKDAERKRTAAERLGRSLTAGVDITSAAETVRELVRVDD